MNTKARIWIEAAKLVDVRREEARDEAIGLCDAVEEVASPWYLGCNMREELLALFGEMAEDADDEVFERGRCYIWGNPEFCSDTDHNARVMAALFMACIEEDM